MPAGRSAGDLRVLCTQRRVAPEQAAHPLCKYTLCKNEQTRCCREGESPAQALPTSLARNLR